MHWLLLRGLVREARHWGAFPAHFTGHLPGHQTHTLDLPGVGTAKDRPVPLSVPAITDDLRERLGALRASHPDGPWGILAVSLGGMVALDWLSRFPSDFTRGVVINTSAADLSSPFERLSWRQYGRVLRCLVASPLGREETILKMTSSRCEAHAALPAAWARFAEETPVPKSVLFRQLFAASRARLPRRVEVPLLVLGSKGDRLVAPACSERIAKKLGAPLRMHEDAGHDLPLDAPEWVAGQVAQWLDKVASSAA